MNIPNQITLARLVLAAAVLIVLEVVLWTPAGERSTLLGVCFWLFLVATLSDALDGWLARRWGQESAFGRVADPLVDKLLVLGAFTQIALLGRIDASTPHISGWLLVVMIARELLSTGLRREQEQQGRKFAALWSGKAKMLVQSTTVCVILAQIAWFPSALQVAQACVYVTALVTVLSIVPYVVALVPKRAGDERPRRSDNQFLDESASAAQTPASRPRGISA